MRRILAAVVMLLASGCTGGSPESAGTSVDSGSSDFDASKGSIDGFVTNDALEPLEGVLVGVVETEQNATSDSAGRFFLSDLRPGIVTVAAQKLGYESVARTVEIVAGASIRLSFGLSPLGIEEPYYETKVQDGLIGCGVLLKQNNDPNASHNLVAACGVFGNAGYYDIDKFHLAWPMGDLEETTGAWGETTWRPTQAAGKGLSALWTVWDSANTAGGTYSFRRINAVQSPLTVHFTSEEIMQLLEARTTIQDCTIGNCTIHTYHYGRAETIGTTPVDVGLALQQRYREYFTLFYNQALPERFTALPDG